MPWTSANFKNCSVTLRYIHRIASAPLPAPQAEIIKVYEAVEVERSERLLDCVKAGEARAARLYTNAEQILAGALRTNDLRTGVQAIRASAAALAEERQYMALRGELTGELGKDNKPTPAWAGAEIIIKRDPAPAPQLPAPAPRLLPTGQEDGRMRP